MLGWFLQVVFFAVAAVGVWVCARALLDLDARYAGPDHAEQDGLHAAPAVRPRQLLPVLDVEDETAGEPTHLVHGYFPPVERDAHQVDVADDVDVDAVA